MRFRILTPALVVLGCVAVAGTAGIARAADPDWKAVEQALGKSGQMMPGDVFRVGMPRTDLTVTVKGVPVKAGFALGSYAAFKQIGDQAMVMGDLVLLDQEVPAVMSGLFAGGLEVTAVHNHLNEISPHVMYMHYEGHGDAIRLATSLRQALSASGTPLGGAAMPPPAGARGRADARQGADRAGAWARRAGHRRRRFSGHGAAGRAHHRHGHAALAGNGRDDGAELPAHRGRSGGHHRRLRPDRQGSESRRPRFAAARDRRDGAAQPRAPGHATALLHAFLGER